MKKSVAIVLTGLAVGLGFISESRADERSWAWSPLGIGLAAPIQLPFVESDVYGLRLGGFFGYNHDVCGLDAGVAEMTAGDFAGIQASAMSWTRGSVYGIQCAALANVVMGNAIELQVAPLNVNWGDTIGLQAGVVNYDSNFKGIEVGALVNWNTTMFYGLELGAINANQNEIAGCAIAGLVNYSEKFSGFALSPVNVSYEVEGCQIGVVNACDRLHGVQIGVVNLITESKLPIMVLANASF